MSKTTHTIFLTILAAIVLTTSTWLVYNGLHYYSLSLGERVYHPDHAFLRPSGILGHGVGIIGSLFMIIGVGSYMARKRYRFLSRSGLLKHWLEFHIFLCTLGPVLVLFHTSFKFGGLVAISFWSMVIVFLSGIIGRFIYIQIPRSIEGRELDIPGIVKNSFNLNEESYEILVDSVKKKDELYNNNSFVRYVKRNIDEGRAVQSVKTILKKNKLPEKEYKNIISLIKYDIRLNHKIERLDMMHNLFKYWHVAHLPFAMVMLIIMVIHVGVTLLFGYRWIF
jgi:hypothetical protein